MAAKITPLGDRVVAKALEAKQKTDSGILLPDSAKEKPKLAEVVAIGPDVKNIKVKDHILYEDFSQTEVKINDEEYIIVKEEKVLGTVK